MMSKSRRRIKLKKNKNEHTKRKKISLSFHLKEILQKEVKLNGHKKNVKLLKTLIDLLINQMKECSNLFNLIFKRVYYTGSYFENLRVKNATEFDINIVLCFPFSNDEWKFDNNERPNAFCRCQLAKLDWEEFLTKNKIHNETIKLFNEENYLLPDKVKSWFQKIIDISIKKLGINEIKPNRNGPAITLKVINENIALDVDLVPVLEFNFSDLPNRNNYSFLEEIPNKEKNFFIIPKPPSEDICKSNHLLQLWRLHFPGIESYLLNKENTCIKSIIKLMKLLRDKEDWKKLAFYYLKTVVMLEITKQKDLTWSQDQMDHLFIKMLKRLDEYICNKNLPHIMFPELNLFHKIKDGQFDHIHRRLRNIIDHILKDKSSINKYLSNN